MLGGNMVIAQLVFSRNQRKILRNIDGLFDIVFIVLNMTKICQKKRLQDRHGKSISENYMKALFKYAEFCEPAGVDEVNAYNLTVNENMTPEDVVQKMFTIIQ